jgi:hypothetical protein
MALDLFEKLADLDVPPPPARFDQQLHERVNRSLLIGQLLDLIVGAAPWALGQFARAFVGMVIFTLTGRYESKTNRKRRR